MGHLTEPGNADFNGVGVGVDVDRGPWGCTFSGQRFYPLDFTADCIRIDDIARGLACQARFGGQTQRFYSVAEHSAIMCGIAGHRWGDAAAQQALLHDATEAYLGDVIRPLKMILTEYQQIEDRVWQVIAAHFGVDPVLGPDMIRLDNEMLAAEKYALLPNAPEWPDLPPPPPELGAVFPAFGDFEEEEPAPAVAREGFIEVFKAVFPDYREAA